MSQHVRAVEVERPRADGPFHIGDRYEVIADGADERAAGTIVNVVATGPNHVRVVVEPDAPG